MKTKQLDQYLTEVQHSVCWYGSDKCHLILETYVECLQLFGSYCG